MDWLNKNTQITFFFKVQNSIKIIEAMHWWNQACFFCGYFWVSGMLPVLFFHGWAIGKWALKWPQPQVSNWANSSGFAWCQDLIDKSDIFCYFSCWLVTLTIKISRMRRAFQFSCWKIFSVWMSQRKLRKSKHEKLKGQLIL